MRAGGGIQQSRHILLHIYSTFWWYDFKYLRWVFVQWNGFSLFLLLFIFSGRRGMWVVAGGSSFMYNRSQGKWEEEQNLSITDRPYII